MLHKSGSAEQSHWNIIKQLTEVFENEAKGILLLL